MDLSRRMVLLDDTAAALRMVRAELATVEAEVEVAELRQVITGRPDSRADAPSGFPVHRERVRVA